MSNFQTELTQWVKDRLGERSDIQWDPDNFSLQALLGDAGFRQYYRSNTQPSLLAVAAQKTPGSSESAEYFAELAGQLREEGVPTPQIIACDKDKNFLLLEDLGDKLFLAVLNDDSVELLYGEAIMVLLRMQQIPVKKIPLPEYSDQLLHDEMALFPQWFAEKLLGYSLADEERALIQQTFQFLTEQALAQPQVLVHRDYHSRNLIYREGEAPGVIDFQDAVWGPATYDLVSLLKDCYIRWQPEQLNRWLIGYGNLAVDLGILPQEDAAQLPQWFHTMGLQRHIKILGIFARLFLRDGKDGYLKDLPLTLRYTLEAAEYYPQTQPFKAWVIDKLLPIMEQQPWYSDYRVAGNS